MKLKRPFVAAGIAASAVGLSLGLGISAATASTTSTTTPSHSSTPTSPSTHKCPNMGSNGTAPAPTGVTPAAPTG